MSEMLSMNPEAGLQVPPPNVNEEERLRAKRAAEGNALELSNGDVALENNPDDITTTDTSDAIQDKPMPRPIPEPPRTEKPQLVIADITDTLKQEARDAGDKAMEADKEELKGVKGFFTKIWKHNLFREVYRQKEIEKAKKAILETGNIYAFKDGDETASDEAKDQIVERFASEFEEAAIHKDAGEKKEVLGVAEKAEDRQAQEAMRAGVLDLMKAYVRGDVDDANFEDEKRRLFNKIYGRDEKAESSMYTDNLKKVAEHIKGNIDHYGGLENLDLDLSVVKGLAKTGARTEANMSGTDKFIEKLHSTKAGRLINETTLAAGVAVAQSLATNLGTSAVRNIARIAGPLGGIAVSAGMAYAKEGNRLEHERRQVARETAEGAAPADPKEAKRRAEMEKHLYEMKSSADLQKDLETELYDEHGNVKVTTEAEAQAVVAKLAEINSRIKLSDLEKIDLITYSNARAVEKERFALDIARAKAVNALTTHGFPTIGGKPVAEAVKIATETRMSDLNKESIDKKDKTFREMKRKKCADRAVKAALIGGTVGLAVQEIGAAFKPDERGLAEGLITHSKSERHLTALAALGNLFKREHISNSALLEPSDNNIHDLGEHGLIRLPEGTSMSANPDGTYNLIHNGKQLAEHLTITKEGALTQESIDNLKGHGILASAEHTNTSVADTTSETVTDKGFVQHHMGEMTKVARKLWYDNDTRAPHFDKNELKLWWGENGTGMDTNGNYVFDMSHMKENWSYHGGEHTNAHELMHNGKLAVLLSVSRGTQKEVFEIPIGPDGKAIIAHDSPAAKLFSEQNGHAVFLGKYAEVAQLMGKNEHNEEDVRILATHVGEGAKKLTDDIPTQVITDAPANTISIPGTPENPDWYAPTILPIMSRDPLEKAKEKEEGEQTSNPDPNSPSEQTPAPDQLTQTNKNQVKEGPNEPTFINKPFENRNEPELVTNPFGDKQNEPEFVNDPFQSKSEPEFVSDPFGDKPEPEFVNNPFESKNEPEFVNDPFEKATTENTDNGYYLEDLDRELTSAERSIAAMLDEHDFGLSDQAKRDIAKDHEFQVLTHKLMSTDKNSSAYEEAEKAYNLKFTELHHRHTKG